MGDLEGADIDFQIAGKEDKLRVFTTRPDTLFGSTYMVIAAEHPLIEKYKDEIENIDEIREYQKEVSKKSDFERTEIVKGKKLEWRLKASRPLIQPMAGKFLYGFLIMF